MWVSAREHAAGWGKAKESLETLPRQRCPRPQPRAVSPAAAQHLGKGHPQHPASVALPGHPTALWVRVTLPRDGQTMAQCGVEWSLVQMVPRAREKLCKPWGQSSKAQAGKPGAGSGHHPWPEAATEVSSSFFGKQVTQEGTGANTARKML